MSCIPASVTQPCHIRLPIQQPSECQLERSLSAVACLQGYVPFPAEIDRVNNTPSPLSMLSMSYYPHTQTYRYSDRHKSRPLMQTQLRTRSSAHASVLERAPVVPPRVQWQRAPKDTTPVPQGLPSAPLGPSLRLTCFLSEGCNRGLSRASPLGPPLRQVWPADSAAYTQAWPAARTQQGRPTWLPA